jgi:hypothetical protein
MTEDQIRTHAEAWERFRHYVLNIWGELPKWFAELDGKQSPVSDQDEIIDQQQILMKRVKYFALPEQMRSAWLARPLWRIDVAASLLCNKNPSEHFPNDAEAWYSHFMLVYSILTDAAYSELLQTVVAPVIDEFRPDLSPSGPMDMKIKPQDVLELARNQPDFRPIPRWLRDAFEDESSSQAPERSRSVSQKVNHARRSGEIVGAARAVLVLIGKNDLGEKFRMSDGSIHIGRLAEYVNELMPMIWPDQEREGKPHGFSLETIRKHVSGLAKSLNRDTNV